MTQPTPGWFPDPTDPSRQRYFDGKAWTESYAPFPPPPQAASASKPAKQQWNLKLLALIVGGFLFLLFIGNLGSDNDEKATASAKQSSTVTPTRAQSAAAAPTTAARPIVAPAGSSVRDGKFEFQVLGVERSSTKPGLFNPEPAKGEFVIIKLRVTNIGDEARTFWAGNQKLIINGNEYEASSSLSDDGFRQDINPGLVIVTEVMFDVPPGAVPDAIVLHDSAFSGGGHLAL